jgi:SanA protein
MKGFRFKIHIKILLVLAVLAPLALLIASNCWIVQDSEDVIFEDPDRLPGNEVGLLLGTSKHIRGGGLNPHFRSRIDAAARLFEAGKVKHILASGDHLSDAQYDEPYTMKEELIRRGIPAEAITLDLAGLRTLDSIVRANRIFGLERFTIISQGYHNARAVFIARHHGLDVVAFSAGTVPAKFERWARSREYLARVKALIDLYILDTQPEVLGEVTPIEAAN